MFFPWKYGICTLAKVALIVSISNFFTSKYSQERNLFVTKKYLLLQILQLSRNKNFFFRTCHKSMGVGRLIWIKSSSEYRTMSVVPVHVCHHRLACVHAQCAHICSIECYCTLTVLILASFFSILLEIWNDRALPTIYFLATLLTKLHHVAARHIHFFGHVHVVTGPLERTMRTGPQHIFAL